MSDVKEIETILTTNRFFGRLSPEQLAQLAPHARQVAFAKDAFIIHEGEPATRFYLLTDGNIALSTHRPRRGKITIQTLHKGEVLGWSWLFAPHEWHFDAYANTAVAVLAFDALAVRAACEADHELGYQLMRRFASIMLERLQATRLRLLDVYGLPKQIPSMRSVQ